MAKNFFLFLLSPVHKPFFRSLLVAFALLAMLSSCKLGRFVIYNFADIKDHKKFPSRPLSAGEQKFRFASSSNGAYPKAIKWGEKKDSVSLDWILEHNKTVAFLIIRNDTIQ